jgi:hypothetical protein
MTTKVPEHDLNHEVYLDPKDHKEHVNHGMLEYTEEDLKTSHAYYDEYHKGEEVDAFHDHEEDEANPGDGKINDWHTRHQDSKLEVYCDNHPDALECRVYDE